MKKALRAEIAARVDLLDSDYKSAADAAIQKNVKNLPAYNASKFLFCYVSIDSEPNTYSILASALMQGKRVCVPKYHGGS